MKFTIIPANEYIWNIANLTEFLITHQEQDIEISTNVEGCCCRTIGLYDLLDQFNFNSVTIYTPNPLEKHNIYTIKIVTPWKFLYVKKEIASEFHTWNKTKIFGTLYGRPLWHRIGIVAHLLTFHADTSITGCLCNPSNVDQRELFETNELFKHSLTSFQNFGNIINQLPVRLPLVDNYTPGQLDTDGYLEQTKQVYKNFLIDIVAETFTSGDCFFITEKTVRPMLLKKPFIIFGSRNYLDYLHQMGFRTFADFWSEDYDGHDNGNRFVKILTLIDSLAKKSVAELEQMYWDMQYTLDHNYNLLLNQSYKKEITYIE